MRGRVTQQVVFALFARNLLEPGHQIVRIQDGEATGPGRKRVHYLLIGSSRRGKLRNNLPRLIVSRIAIRTADAGPTGARTASRRALAPAGPSAASAASGTTLTSAGSTSAARPASRATTCAAS